MSKDKDSISHNIRGCLRSPQSYFIATQAQRNNRAYRLIIWVVKTVFKYPKLLFRHPLKTIKSGNINSEHNYNEHINGDYIENAIDKVENFNVYLDAQNTNNKKTAKIEPKEEVAFSISGNINRKKIKRLENLISLLSLLAEDDLISVIDIEEGSIKLILKGSKSGLERLERLLQSDELTKSLEQKLGITIENARLTNAKTKYNNQNLKTTGIEKNLVITIAGNVNQADIDKLKAVLINNSERKKVNRRRDQVLRRYAAGQRNFQGVNIRGQSFKGQDLSGADFSNADIRSTNFSNATLIDANFSGVKCGLQRRWAIWIVAISWGLSWLSGRLVGLSVVFLSSLFNVSSETFDIKYYLDNPIVFLLVFSIVGTAIVTVALGGGIANAIGVASSMAVATRLAASIAVSISVVVTWKVVAASSLAKATVVTLILTEIYILLSAYVGWMSITLEKKHFFIRPLSIFLATWKGTNFQGANLTDANLSNAIVRNTDFRQSNITRTFWFHAKKLDLVRSETTYLNNRPLRQLLITGKGKNKNFDRQDLRGVNLQRANLENASFIDADFYQANLQETNLSRSILVRSNFEKADLRNANLTGSCIQDWVITESTKVDGIICDYVHLKWINGDKRDQMPPRGKFKQGGFVTYLRYILETVELYHEKDINPRFALNVLQEMSRDYDEPFDIVALGKKGDKIFIQVKVSENIIRENFKEDYYSRYDRGLKLWAGNIHHLLPSVNSLIEKRISQLASERTDDYLFVNATIAAGDHIEIYQREVQMSGNKHIQVAGDYRETHVDNQSTYVEGDYYNNPEQKQTLSQAATEIQQLLENLSETYPTTTSKEKNIVIGEAVEQIENNPTLKAKVINALKAGGTEAFKEAVNHPLVNILVATIEGWQDAESSTSKD